MSHHEEEKSYDYVYYIVALLSGMFVGAIIEKGFIWILIGGVVGLLTAALYIKTLVRGRSSH